MLVGVLCLGLCLLLVWSELVFGFGGEWFGVTCCWVVGGVVMWRVCLVIGVERVGGVW